MKTYEELRKEEILFKIRGENETNKIINKAIPKLLKVFEGLEDKQVLKSNASVCYAYLLKKYKDKTDLILRSVEEEFKNEEISPTLFLNVSAYSVYLSVKLRFNKISNSNFLYYENTKYFLNITDLKIRNIYKFEELKQINPQEQIKIFNKCLKLKGELEKEKEKLKPYCLRKLLK